MKTLLTTEGTVDTEVHKAKRNLLLGVLRVLCGGALVGVTFAGCGYTLAGRGSFLPASIQRIGIPAFTNRTPIFNLETLLTARVRGEFIGRGKYQILPQDTGVDAVLIGDVSSVSINAAAFNDQQLASRYTLTIVASIQLRDVRENKVLWENPSMVFREDYQNTSGTNTLDPAAFFGQETNALDRVSSDFAKTIVSSILEAF